MTFLENNWSLLVIFIIMTIFWYFYDIKKVKEWLLYAVTRAEKELGGGTGQLKLRLVYDWFLAKFPVLSKIISFELFSKLVDLALEKMEHAIETNNAIASYVGKEGE